MREEKRISLKHYGLIDPDQIEDYLEHGGYQSLQKALSQPPAAIVQAVKDAGLRGRGGAGFKAGIKWGFTLQTPAEQKYIICNADEGEPGTFKDRLIMEGDPHLVLEGMAIAGYAVGASKGYIYCRGEYPYIVKRLKRAIEQAREKGLLGTNRFESNFSFDVEVRMGAGAYICGEETALIESLEGKRGEPRSKPPFPGVAGLWGKPTVVNNVETLAAVPWIIEHGATAYQQIGASRYPGTKIFTLTGDVARKGFCEVPTDVTLRELVYDFGGGVAGGKKLQAVQVGGTSGAFLPESLLDTPADLDSMAAVGGTLGSGAVLVVDETRDLVDLAVTIASFFKHESCGKCTPCREGTFQLHRLLEKISRGQGSRQDLETLERLMWIMTQASFCGLGHTAPTPILTMLQYFPDPFNNRVNSQAG
ncbi:MAG: NADH-quinone oxidoreductase subunit NuoF [Syntrophomonadaceae bacterium]|nr:NADH-quinone oxidoreductase subunit NuoF [Syntrophomonadaceae bacterium]